MKKVAFDSTHSAVPGAELAGIASDAQPMPAAADSGPLLPGMTDQYAEQARYLLTMLLPVAEEHAPRAAGPLRQVDACLLQAAAAQTVQQWAESIAQAREALGQATFEWETVRAPTCYHLWGICYGIERTLDIGDEWAKDASGPTLPLTGWKAQTSAMLMQVRDTIYGAREVCEGGDESYRLLDHAADFALELESHLHPDVNVRPRDEVSDSDMEDSTRDLHAMLKAAACLPGTPIAAKRLLDDAQALIDTLSDAPIEAPAFIQQVAGAGTNGDYPASYIDFIGEALHRVTEIEASVAGAAALVRASIDGNGEEQSAAYAERLLRGQVASQGEALRDWLDQSTSHYG